MATRRRSVPPAASVGTRARAASGSVRTAAYLRVSTEGQLDGTSIDTQRGHCQDLATRHGLTLVGEYVDAGISGATTSRPALDEVLAAATTGDIQVIVVAKLDRLGRSLLHLLELLSTLDAAGVRVVSATDGIDTRTPAGRLMLQLLGVFAEFERERIRERSQDGHHRRAQLGGFVGTTPPFGYRAVPNPTGAGFVLAIDEKAAACIRAMYRLLVVERVPVTQAVKALNAAGHLSDSGRPWTKQTLSRWARGDGPTTATGVWRWLDLKVPIPLILTTEQHAAWTAWLRETAKPAQRHTAYLLGGRVRTPCGRYFHGRTAGRQNPLYVCRHHLTTPAGDPTRCDCISIRVDTLDQLVWSEIRAALTTPPPAAPAAARRRGDARRTAGERDGVLEGGPRLDIGADTLADRITTTAEDIADLQATIAEEYQAARADGFDPATARLMLQPRRDDLARAQAALELLHQVRSTMTPAASAAQVDRDAVERARVRLDDLDLDLDLDGKQQVLDLLEVRAEVTGYHACDTCAGAGYSPIPPGTARHWPPSCPACHRLKVLPDLAVDIGHANLLLQAQTGRDAQSAG